MTEVLCPHCRSNVANDGSLAGQVVMCPHCRGQFQMPILSLIPQRPSEFEEIEEPVIFPSRRRSQRSFAGLWFGALAVLFIAVIGGLWAAGIIQFKPPQKDADQHAQTKDVAGGSRPGERRTSRTSQATRTTEKPDDREKKDEQLKEAARKKALEEALRTAVPLQAPPGREGPGVMRKYPEFAQQMRELASNEFAFRKAQDAVYRTTFNQRDQTAGLVANYMYFAFNGVLDPGSYDFESKRYSLTLYFWYEYYKESKGLGGRTLPETKDYCVLRTTIEVDPDTAAKMRAAYDKKSLSLTVTYRLKRVTEGTWAANPHFTGDSRIAHNLAFEAEVLRFDWFSDGR